MEWLGVLHQHSKALLVPRLFSLGTLLVLCLSPHLQHVPTSQDRLQADGILSLSLHGLHVPPPPPFNVSLGPVLPGGFAPGSCQDLLSIWKSLSLKLSPVNTHLVLTWLCCPGKLQFLFFPCSYPFG